VDKTKNLLIKRFYLIYGFSFIDTTSLIMKSDRDWNVPNLGKKNISAVTLKK